MFRKYVLFYRRCFRENNVNYSYCIRGLPKKHVLSCYLKAGFMSKTHGGGQVNSALNIVVGDVLLVSRMCVVISVKCHFLLPRVFFFF